MEFLLYKVYLGFSRARHIHLGRQHVQGSAHEGLVFSSVRSLNLITFIRVKHYIIRWDSIIFAMH